MKKVRMMLCGVLAALMLAGCGGSGIGKYAVAEAGTPAWTRKTEDRVDTEAPMLDVMQGVLRCGGCRLSSGGLSLPLTESAVQALRYILYCPPKKLYGFTLGARDMRMLDRAGEAFCAVQLERGFRTLDYYKAFLPVEEE